jgi:hypothetical protein
MGQAESNTAGQFPIARIPIKSPVIWARVAGVLWLICIACGMFAEAYVRGKLVLPHDPAGTVRNIYSNEQLYRLGFTLEFLGTAAYLALTAIIYRLLAPVDPTVSLIAAFFSVAGCTIWMANVAGDMSPFVFRDVLTSAQAEPTRSIAFALVRLRSETLVSGMFCFGVQCLLVGYLIARSTCVPKVLGVVLALGGAGYIVSAGAHFLWPVFAAALHGYAYLPGEVGEILLGLWLTIAGLMRGSAVTASRLSF